MFQFNSYFSSDRIKIPPPPPTPAPSDWIRKVHWTIPVLNIDKFYRKFHVIEKHDKQATLLIANEVTELRSEVTSLAEL